MLYTKSFKCIAHLPVLRTSSGDHTVVETPVPIPNTVVKHPGPMIVRVLAKVGIARFYDLAWEKFQARFFYALSRPGTPHLGLPVSKVVLNLIIKCYHYPHDLTFT